MQPRLARQREQVLLRHAPVAVAARRSSRQSHSLASLEHLRASKHFFSVCSDAWVAAKVKA